MPTKNTLSTREKRIRFFQECLTLATNEQDRKKIEQALREEMDKQKAERKDSSERSS